MPSTKAVQLHKWFSGVSVSESVTPVVSPASPASKPVSSRIADDATLEEMKTVIRQHLCAALLECSALSRDLQLVDPDQVLIDLRASFDPNLETSIIQDCFADAFHPHITKDSLFSKRALPSGAAI